MVARESKSRRTMQKSLLVPRPSYVSPNIILHGFDNSNAIKEKRKKGKERKEKGKKRRESKDESSRVEPSLGGSKEGSRQQYAEWGWIWTTKEKERQKGRESISRLRTQPASLIHLPPPPTPAIFFLSAPFSFNH